MAAELKIIVGADVKQAERNLKGFVSTAQKTGNQAGVALGAGLNKATPAFTKIQSAAKPAILAVSKLGDTLETLRAKLGARQSFLVTEKDIRKVAILNAEIKSLQKEIIRVQSIGSGGALGGVGKGATKAFSALRTAANILPGIGIGGLVGIGVDAISSLFGAADKANEKIKELLVSVGSISSEAAAGTAGEAAKVNALVGVVANLNKSYAERNRALNELKGINKNYFGDMTLEASKLAILKDRANEYTQALIQQAVIKAFEDQIGKVAVAISQQSKEFEKAEEKVNSLNKALRGASKQNSLPGFVSNQASGIQRQIEAATGDLNDQEKTLSKLRQGYGELDDAMNEAVQTMLKFRPLDDVAKGAGAAADKTIAIAKRLAAFLDKNTQFSVVFEVDETKSESENIAAARRFIEKARSFVETAAPVFKFKPLIFTEFGFKIDKKIVGEIKKQAEVEASKTYEEVKKEFEKGIEEAAKRNPLSVKTTADVNIGIRREERRNQFQADQFNFQPEPPKDAQGNNLFSEQELSAMKFAGTINSVLTPAFQNMFSAIAAGENPMKALFESIGQSVLQLIQKLIAAAIQAAILSAIFPGGVGGAKGFGAIFGKLTGFASGGLVTGPMLAMVGEGRGTSSNNPEAIIPLDQLRGMLGDMGNNQQQTVVVMGRIRGNDLALSNSRTSRRNRRLAG